MPRFIRMPYNTLASFHEWMLLHLGTLTITYLIQFHSDQYLILMLSHFDQCLILIDFHFDQNLKGIIACNNNNMRNLVLVCIYRMALIFRGSNFLRIAVF